MWAVTAPPDSFEGEVRHHPERRECLFLLSDHQEFGQVVFVAEVTKDEEGKRQIGDWVDSGSGDYVGLYAHFVPPAPISSEDQQQMREFITRMDAATEENVY
jgi:hypothetical protein